MSRTAVRSAIATYLLNGGINGTGQIQYLTQVFAHPPKLTQQGDFVQGEDPGLGTGAVIYIHLRESAQRRISGGPAARPPTLGDPNPSTPASKSKLYELGLICVLRSQKRTTQEAGADNDLFLDTLEEWILRDRTADSNGVIFQWGEGDQFGATDVHVKAGMPRAMKTGTTQVFSTIDITVMEILHT